MSEAPSCQVDLFADATVVDPYPLFRELRELGPVVHFSTDDFYALTHYENVRAAGADYTRFSSADGVGLVDELNAGLRGTVLGSDPPEHSVLRAVLFEQLSPRAIKKLQEPIAAKVSSFVAEAVARGSFDGVKDLAARIPVDIVADLIGLPPHGRELLLPGADALFETFGPMTPRLQAGWERIGAYFSYVAENATRAQLTPGSWGAAIFAAVDAGKIREDQAMPLMSAYLVAGMDTTVNSIGFFLQYLAAVPGLWGRVQSDPTLGKAVYNEALRLETPVQAFFRRTRGEQQIAGVHIPDGAPIALLFGCANRDALRYGADAEWFDAERNPVDHLAFGYGTHSCAGQGLARLEAQSLMKALVEQVDTIELAGPPTLHIHPIVRGLEALPLRVTPRY